MLLLFTIYANRQIGLRGAFLVHDNELGRAVVSGAHFYMKILLKWSPIFKKKVLDTL